MCPLEKSSLGFPCKLLRRLFVQITRDAISRAYQCTCWSAGTVFLATQHLSERRKQTNPITSTESTVNPATAPITSGICNKYAAGGKKKSFLLEPREHCLERARDIYACIGYIYIYICMPFNRFNLNTSRYTVQLFN